MADDLDENYDLEDEYLPKLNNQYQPDNDSDSGSGAGGAVLNEPESDSDDDEEELPILKNTKPVLNEISKKRKLDEPKLATSSVKIAVKSNNPPGSSLNPAKKKKKNLTDILKLNEKEINKASYATKEFKKILVKHIMKNLSTVEKYELNFTDESSDLSEKRIEKRLNQMILKRKSSLAKLSFDQHFNKKFNNKFGSYLQDNSVQLAQKQSDKHAPFALVLCSSAMRCIDVQRLLDAQNKYFKQKKINWFHAFAKHKKLNEQVEFLKKKSSNKNSKNIDLVFATPQRLAQLIEANCFDFNQLKYVIIDYTHRDCKLKRFVDMNEIKQEFMSLLFKHLIFLNKQLEKIKFKFYLV